MLKSINILLELLQVLLIFKIAIIMIHIHNHLGIWIDGKNLIKDTITKMKSATVSNRAPDSLMLFVHRATVPSIISLNPHKRYKI